MPVVEQELSVVCSGNDKAAVAGQEWLAAAVVLVEVSVAAPVVLGMANGGDETAVVRAAAAIRSCFQDRLAAE